MLAQASNVTDAPWEKEGLTDDGMKMDFVFASLGFENEGSRGKERKEEVS